ncbi:hypothetical protein PAGU2196_37350 [Pseudomonas sp. PAGU 2196]|uniref:hypothetical protein n=1 Tax=Pseudomonas sp. PAGU 2196 TaxID=2793997 RepID=UPI001EDE1BCE|nr:hypothetical protein [Pseudomonas sp. PAGU 2196]GHS82901.1 hypothetical protein PAGU2196_37350 [Pseudomonas sp. PAGU 2196]
MKRDFFIGTFCKIDGTPLTFSKTTYEDRERIVSTGRFVGGSAEATSERAVSFSLEFIDYLTTNTFDDYAQPFEFEHVTQGEAERGASGYLLKLKDSHDYLTVSPQTYYKKVEGRENGWRLEICKKTENGYRVMSHEELELGSHEVIIRDHGRDKFWSEWGGATVHEHKWHYIAGVELKHYLTLKLEITRKLSKDIGI